jgi:hypothetical protein
MWVAIYLCMKQKWTAGIAIWSLGVGVKMTLVLLVPGIAIITLLSLGLVQSIGLGVMAVLVQVSNMELASNLVCLRPKTNITTGVARNSIPPGKSDGLSIQSL